MKKIILFLLLTPWLTNAQWQENEGGLRFEQVFEQEGNASTLKNAAQEWVATTYNDANTVLKMNTAEKMVVSGQFDVHYTYQGYSMGDKITYNLIAEFKDGRYKVTVEDIYNTKSSYPVAPQSISFEQYKEMIQEQADKASTKYEKKVMEKMLKKEDKLKEQYDDAMGLQNQIAEQSKTHINTLIASLNRKLEDSKSTESDW